MKKLNPLYKDDMGSMPQAIYDPAGGKRQVAFLDELTPRTYVVEGNLLKGDSPGTAVGYGIASIVILGKLARIDFSIRVTKAGSVASATAGIRTEFITQLNDEIPHISATNIPWGIVTWYNSNGIADLSFNGYACIAMAFEDGAVWRIGRKYDLNLNPSTWADTAYTLNTRIVGTCFGVVE